MVFFFVEIIIVLTVLELGSMGLKYPCFYKDKGALKALRAIFFLPLALVFVKLIRYNYNSAVKICRFN